MLWFWADKSLKKEGVANEVAPEWALAFARSIDGSDLFKDSSNDRVERSMRRGGVAGCAAVVLKYRSQFSPDDVIWAKDVIMRAATLDAVALAALNECLSLWDVDPRFAWCALWEALALCQFTVRPMEAGARIYNPSYIAPKRAVHADEAIAYFNKPDHWPDLPAMPPA